MPKKEGAKKAAVQKTRLKKAISDTKVYICSLEQLRYRNVEWTEIEVVQAESLSAEKA